MTKKEDKTHGKDDVEVKTAPKKKKESTGKVGRI
jgi:hypothetical protein